MLQLSPLEMVRNYIIVDIIRQSYPSRRPSEVCLSICAVFTYSLLWNSPDRKPPFFSVNR